MPGSGSKDKARIKFKTRLQKIRPEPDQEKVQNNDPKDKARIMPQEIRIAGCFSVFRVTYCLFSSGWLQKYIFA